MPAPDPTPLRGLSWALYTPTPSPGLVTANQVPSPKHKSPNPSRVSHLCLAPHALSLGVLGEGQGLDRSFPQPRVLEFYKECCACYASRDGMSVSGRVLQAPTLPGVLRGLGGAWEDGAGAG